MRFWDGTAWTDHTKPLPHPGDKNSGTDDAPLSDQPPVDATPITTPPTMATPAKEPPVDTPREDVRASAVPREGEKPSTDPLSPPESTTAPSDKPGKKASQKNSADKKKSPLSRLWVWIAILVVIAAILAVLIKLLPVVEKDGFGASQSPSSSAVPLVNGDFHVGTDITPGVYRADIDESADGIGQCAISQADGNQETLDAQAAPQGSVIFTVVDMEKSVVTFTGCTSIGLAQGKLRANPDPVTNGYWLVGDELPAATYRGIVDTEAVVIFATMTQTGPDGTPMKEEYSKGGDIIFTVDDVPGSVVAFLGFSEIVTV